MSYVYERKSHKGAKSLSHFEFIFVHGVRVHSNFTDLDAAANYTTMSYMALIRGVTLFLCLTSHESVLKVFKKCELGNGGVCACVCLFVGGGNKCSLFTCSKMCT